MYSRCKHLSVILPIQSIDWTHLRLFDFKEYTETRRAITHCNIFNRKEKVPAMSAQGHYYQWHSLSKKLALDQ
jgi:hypothetical protein